MNFAKCSVENVSMEGVAEKYFYPSVEIKEKVVGQK